jgi:hypothetical protein
MPNHSFSVNLRGRVKNTNLPTSYPLIPIFEAIVNSFEAIDERRRYYPDDKYYININVSYDGQRALFEEDNKIARNPKSFIIEDNGIGFTDDNLKSFLTSDSSYKESLGGKGVGRFVWLKAFESVDVDSVYEDKVRSFHRRQFNFMLDDEDLKNLTESVTDGPVRTQIKLNSLSPDYSKNVPKGLDTIAMKIIEHCFILFLKKDCPQVILQDSDDKVNLNELFTEKINVDSNRVNFSIKDHSFSLLHIKLTDSSLRGHKAYLCANSRVVEEEILDKYIVDLCYKMKEGRQEYWYAGIVEGTYLDNNVNSERITMNLPDSSDDTTISKEEIVRKVSEIVEEYFSDQLQTIRKQKMVQITAFARDEAPQFRHLLKHKEDELKKIKPGLSGEKLYDQFSRINREFDKEVKEQGEKVLRDFKNSSVADTEAYKELFDNLFRKINDINKSTLADYVGHRKTILQMMDEALKSLKDGKYEKEKFLHNLIFPMGTTSDDLPYDQHNLWLIDEKLAFHFFLSSDKPLKTSTTDSRPDIMVLDNPIATADTEENAFHNSIVIFELKKPMRDDYTDGDNPIDQLIGYVKKISEGSALDCNRRPIKVNDHTRYYLYAICDVTPSLSTILKKYGFKQTPDGEGYFMHNEPYNAYIEVLPFDKLVHDSKKRNKVLFEKLGCN